MKLYSTTHAASLIGKLINYQHIASDYFCGPVQVITVHAGSDQLIVSGDVFTGRTISLPLCVTMLEPVILPPPKGEVK